MLKLDQLCFQSGVYNISGFKLHLQAWQHLSNIPLTDSFLVHFQRNFTPMCLESREHLAILHNLKHIEAGHAMKCSVLAEPVNIGALLALKDGPTFCMH